MTKLTLILFFINVIPEGSLEWVNQRLASFWHTLQKKQLNYFHLGQKTVTVIMISLYPVIKEEKVIENVLSIYHVNPEKPLLFLEYPGIYY